jgi:hypothetical protein
LGENKKIIQENNTKNEGKVKEIKTEKNKQTDEENDGRC